MEHFTDGDYKVLNDKLSAKKAFKYEDVKDRLIKVAFDIVRFRDADASIDGLWQIQNTDDGEVIVATYEEKPELQVTATNWAAQTDKAASTAYIFYKGAFVKKFSSKDILPGVSAEDGLNIKDLAEHLPNSLETNASLRNAFINTLLTTDEREAFLSKYPELK